MVGGTRDELIRFVVKLVLLVSVFGGLLLDGAEELGRIPRFHVPGRPVHLRLRRQAEGDPSLRARMLGEAVRSRRLRRNMRNMRRDPDLLWLGPVSGMRTRDRATLHVPQWHRIIPDLYVGRERLRSLFAMPKPYMHSGAVDVLHVPK